MTPRTCIAVTAGLLAFTALPANAQQSGGDWWNNNADEVLKKELIERCITETVGEQREADAAYGVKRPGARGRAQDALNMIGRDMWRSECETKYRRGLLN